MKNWLRRAEGSWLIGYAELKVHGNWLRRAKGSQVFFHNGLHGLYGFSLMGKPLLGLILITRMRASHGSCNHPDGLSPRKRKSAESVIIGINKSAESA